ncbi:MAG: type II toxin-antitoxin system PemK/MazF family toxin [Saprospiraceae bacterium]|nr:type II toxin-antitoxin system PemK/MazF family toxin [Saprospiraceae bacterium]
MYKTGDIILIPFPFIEYTGAKKVRPSVVVCETADGYHDVVVCAISSVMPPILSANEIPLLPDTSNNLRTSSVLKVDRIVTVQAINIIAKLGELSAVDQAVFITKFRSLV